MMDTVGYATIKKDATTGRGDKLDTFIGKDCRVLEFASDGGILALNREGTAIATFEKQDVCRKFECSVFGDFICPPKMDAVAQMAYMTKVMSRKGGYAPILREMVIQASLAKGVFTDGFLFQKERDDAAREEWEQKKREKEMADKPVVKVVNKLLGE